MNVGLDCGGGLTFELGLGFDAVVIGVDVAVVPVEAGGNCVGCSCC